MLRCSAGKLFSYQENQSGQAESSATLQYLEALNSAIKKNNCQTLDEILLAPTQYRLLSDEQLSICLQLACQESSSLLVLHFILARSIEITESHLQAAFDSLDYFKVKTVLKFFCQKKTSFQHLITVDHLSGAIDKCIKTADYQDHLLLQLFIVIAPQCLTELCRDAVNVMRLMQVINQGYRTIDKILSEETKVWLSRVAKAGDAFIQAIEKAHQIQFVKRLPYELIADIGISAVGASEYFDEVDAANTVRTFFP